MQQAPSKSGFAWAGTAALVVGVWHFWEILCYHHDLNTMDVAEQKIAGLKTENAFYYSYYEETVSAPTSADAVWSALRDRRSEAPDTINAVERFNIYQELGFGLIYRLFTFIIGPELMPDPWYFFRYCSYFLNGLGHAALVLLAAGCAGGGVMGGVVPAASMAIMLFLHRRDIGRIHDVGMLNLRENWTVPVIWCQVLSLHRILLTHPKLGGDNSLGNHRLWRLSFFVFTVLSVLLWQFSAFAFLLQVSAVFLCTLLSCSSGARTALVDIVTLHLGSLAACTMFLFFNELLVHHMIVTQCLAILAVLWLRRGPPKYRVLFWVDGALAVLMFAGLRILQSRWATAEEHIGEIFTAKLGQLFPKYFPGKAKEPSFNARLYLAVSVFDFIDRGTVERVGVGGVYYFGGVALVMWSLIFGRWVLFTRLGNSDSTTKPSKVTVQESGASGKKAAETSAPACYATAFGYGVLLAQTTLFLVLGCFISRLKVLGAPLLIMLAATAVGPKCMEVATAAETAAGNPSRVVGVLRRLVLVAAVLVQLAQLAYLASFLPFTEGTAGVTYKDMHWPAGEMGELFDWMGQRLPANSTIISSMPLSAELRLSTPFKVVIHPQFEKQSLRDRVQELYQFYQCTSPESYVSTMQKYGAAYLILEYKRCDFSPFVLDKYPKLNCAKGQKPWQELFCPRAHVSPSFKLLFANAGFGLFRVRDVVDAPSKPKRRSMDDIKVWKPMLDRCIKTEPEVCGGRIAEMASMFHEKLGQQQLGKTLLQWVDENAPHDGVAQYLIGRHYDYVLNRPQDAKKYYEKAYELVPNNPVIVREYLMWLDVAQQDNRSLEALMRPRRYSNGDRLSLVELGDASLACEASVPAMELFRDFDWAQDLWKVALREGASSDCVKNNWLLQNNGKKMEETLGPWGFFLNIFWHQVMKSHMVSAASTGVRWAKPRRAWNTGLSAIFQSS